MYCSRCRHFRQLSWVPTGPRSIESVFETPLRCTSLTSAIKTRLSAFAIEASMPTMSTSIFKRESRPMSTIKRCQDGTIRILTITHNLPSLRDASLYSSQLCEKAGSLGNHLTQSMASCGALIGLKMSRRSRASDIPPLLSPCPI